MEKTHIHLDSEERELWELYELLREAQRRWRLEVQTGKKRYGRFVEDFVQRYWYIDCPRAECRGAHRMNLHIVEGMLREGQAMMERRLFGQTLEYGAFLELQGEYNGTEWHEREREQQREQRERAPEVLTLGASFTAEQLEALAHLARKNGVFAEGEVSAEDMGQLLGCRAGFRLRVGNLRRLAVLMDTLLELDLICPNWKAVMERGRFLLNSRGDRVVSASSLSSALSSAKAGGGAIGRRIREGVREAVITNKAQGMSF